MGATELIFVAAFETASICVGVRIPKELPIHAKKRIKDLLDSLVS